MITSFEDRLNFALGSRKPTPWGKRIGLNSATTSGLFSGKQPGSEILSLIMRSENLSISWLLQGKGAPFLVDKAHSANQLNAQLAIIFEEHWENIYIANSPNGLTVVVVKQGQFDFKGTWINYPIIEVLSGPANEQTLEFLRDRSKKGTTNNTLPVPMAYQIKLTENDSEKLSRGQIGTYILLGDDKKGGILSHPDGFIDRCSYPLEDLLPQQSTLTDPADPLLLRAVIEHIENMLIEEDITLESKDKAKLITGLYRHTAKTGQIDPETAKVLMETIAL